MNEPLPPRPGRERRFDLPPREGIANRDAAYLLTALDELHERLFDVLSDLRPEALDFLPDGAGNTIAMLVRHMAFAEVHWVGRATSVPVPADLKARIAAGSQDAATGDLPGSSDSVEDLIALCRQVRETFTIPAVADVEDLDAIVRLDDKEISLRGILLNQLWHWTYHSGQVGLLRRMFGQRYQWRYGKEIKAPGAHQ